jgi:hypothetical protein
MLRYAAKRTSTGLELKFHRLFEGLRPVKTRVEFRSDGICIVRRIFGIPIGRKVFERSRIYGFGYAANGHSQSQMLQFNYAGEGQIILTNYVRESEAAAFLRFLHQEGVDYNTSWECPLKSSWLTTQ